MGAINLEISGGAADDLTDLRKVISQVDKDISDLVSEYSSFEGINSDIASYIRNRIQGQISDLEKTKSRITEIISLRKLRG